MRRIVMVLVVIAGAGSLAVVTFALQRVGVARGYAPEQPIAFSHALHAGENEVPCLYCHFAAEKSRHAGIPPSRLCLSCHALLKAQTVGIAKLKESVAQDRPLVWVKVHNLPDFVNFSHARHVGVGGIECRECHGDVEAMGRLRQQAPLTMGWCIACHRERGMTESAVGLDCSNCHF